MIFQPFDSGGRSKHHGLAKVATTAILALTDEVDMDKVASSYAAAFVAASPAGVSVGQTRQRSLDGYRGMSKPF